jgi:hypothetical protein
MTCRGFMQGDHADGAEPAGHGRHQLFAHIRPVQRRKRHTGPALKWSGRHGWRPRVSASSQFISPRLSNAKRSLASLFSNELALCRRIWLCRFNQERIRARQERNISGVKDGLVEGGEALSKGFVRGMTGIVTKPLEGAKSRGAYGALLAAAIGSLSCRCRTICACDISVGELSNPLCPYALLVCALSSPCLIELTHVTDADKGDLPIANFCAGQPTEGKTCLRNALMLRRVLTVTHPPLQVS